MKKSVLFSIMFLLVWSFFFAACTSKKSTTDMDKTIQQLIDSMTLEEKASYVIGTGIDITGANSAMLIKDSLPAYSGRIFPISRLGLPAVLMSDGPAGLNITSRRAWDSTKMFYNTAIPIASLMASTWDTALVYKIGEVVGDEALRYGIDIWTGPAMNIHRNPLNGRNFEYYSEDPVIAGTIAAAMVRGAQSKGIAATLKHFAANNAETNRFGLNTLASERALREIYLENFRIAVQEGQPKAIMSSYNLINNTYTSQNSDLLLKVLRDDWDYKGFVMSDWWSGDDPVAQVAAGNDITMPGSPSQVEQILKAAKEGKLDEASLNRDVKNLLGFVLVSPKYMKYKNTNDPDLKAHAEVVRQAAAEGMILLKNDSQTLPISNQDIKIALLGNPSYDIIIDGTGSGSNDPAYKVSLAEGLKNAGFTLNQGVMNQYESYLAKAKPKQPADLMSAMLAPVRAAEMTVTSALLNKAAAESDMAIVTIGEVSGEGYDRPLENGFNLSDVQKQLIKNTTEAFHKQGKKVVVVLNICGIVEVASWRDMPDAILLAWAGGQETGNSMADILSGKVNPSGKLAVSIPMSYEDVPSAKNFPGVITGPEKMVDMGFAKMSFAPSRVVYEEGIYNGYRYYESFGVAPAYEFGFGKSYTTFDYGKVTMSGTVFNKELKVTLDVKNSGGIAGKEVVELYLTAPANKLDKPGLELKGFVKTRLLQPGETQTVEFTIIPRNLASFDTSVSSWIAEAGTYEVKVGASSRDIRQTATFELKKELVVKKESRALTPQENINELKATRTALK